MLFEQGDVVEVSFDPARGHEPKKNRSALVVSNNTFNGATSMPVVCPITTTDNGFFLHEPVPSGHVIYGFIAMEQLRAIDLDGIIALSELMEKPVLGLTC